MTEVVGSPLILFPQPQEAEGVTVFSQAWRFCCRKVISLGTDCSDIFFGNLVGVVYSEQNWDLFGSGKNNSKVCWPTHSLTSGKLGLTVAKIQCVFLPHRTEVSRVHLEGKPLLLSTEETPLGKWYPAIFLLHNCLTLVPGDSR